MKEKLLTFFKKETILCIACLLAALSAYIVPPDAAYLGYVDTRVLILLFSLMAVLAGFRALGIFDRMANLLLARAKKMRQLALTLVMLCFFSAMLVTNDVALITFVPFTILLLQRVHLEEKLIPVIVLQTIAANLGSMLTPVGNPQNLYLYTISGICSPLTGVTSDSWDTPAGHRVYDACRGFSVSWVCRDSGASSASSTSC